MFVVVRAFKDHGVLYEAGTVITDPSSIRLFRSRLGSRNIVDMRQDQTHNRNWIDYLQARGHDTSAIEARLLMPSGPAKVAPDVPKVTAAASTGPATTVPKPVLKPAVKVATTATAVK